MGRLTNKQLEVLAEAARREDGAVLPLPERLKLTGGAAAAILRALQAKGLVAPRDGSEGDACADEEDNFAASLVITPAGLAAIGADVEDTTEETEEGSAGEGEAAASSAPSSADDLPPESPPALRPGTKGALLVEMLQREEGASVPEISEATGWQAHSVRGAISGTVKKRLGLMVTAAPEEGRGRVYRIASEARDHA